MVYSEHELRLRKWVFKTQRKVNGSISNYDGVELLNEDVCEIISDVFNQRKEIDRLKNDLKISQDLNTKFMNSKVDDLLASIKSAQGQCDEIIEDNN